MMMMMMMMMMFSEQSHIPNLIILSHKTLLREAQKFILRPSLLGASEAWNWVLNDVGDARDGSDRTCYMVVMVKTPVTE
jgi:hypothetical protein